MNNSKVFRSFLFSILLLGVSCNSLAVENKNNLEARVIALENGSSLISLFKHLSVATFSMFVGYGVNELHHWYKAIQEKQNDFTVKHDKKLLKSNVNDSENIAKKKKSLEFKVSDASESGKKLLNEVNIRNNSDKKLVKMFLSDPAKCPKRDRLINICGKSPVENYEKKIKEKKRLEAEIRASNRKIQEEKLEEE